MAHRALIEILDMNQCAQDMFALVETLYPICRSITGNGVRKTLHFVRKIIPIEVIEVPSGTRVFDWTVPKEWNIKDAYIKNAHGERVVDFRKSNLHVVNYSVPVEKTLSLQELKPHLHALPDHPDWIPYRTSYYNETWGFCLSQDQLQSLEDGVYEIRIDSELKPGALTYGEYLIEGESEDEVLIYTHVCHPSLCNDNLSGIAVTAFLAKFTAEASRRYSYRFVFGPGTIGSLTWLSQNEQQLARIKHGMVVVLVGDMGHFHYKKSRYQNATIDRAAVQALKQTGWKHQILDFSPYGYDERQFCSPGINLPVGRFTRTPNGCYKQYHTSADNLEFIKPANLAESLRLCVDIFNILENEVKYLNLCPKGEPQLGRRGLYQKTGGQQEVGNREFAMLWLLNLADGKHTLLDILERSGLDFNLIYSAAKDLFDAGLIKKTE